MSQAQAGDPPTENKFKECEPIALKDTTWKIHDGLKKFSREEAERIITSHGGTIHTDTATPATHELKYAKASYAMFGGGRATIYEPGFLNYVRSQVMYRRIDPKEVDHNSLYQLALIFAGTMPWLQKSEYKELVQEFGGRVQKKVNTKTNYVVLGYKDVPEAVMKAIEDLGVKTLDEDGFIELLRTRKSPGVGGSRISMEGVEKDLADTGDAEKEKEEKEKEEKEKQVAEKGGVVGDLADTGKEKKKKGKQAAGKAKKVGVEKKNGSGIEKKDAEKQKNPAKKIAGVKKQSGGEASTKAQKEQWAGRLRSRAEEGESSAA